MEDWDPKVKLGILIGIFVIIVLALVFGLIYLITNRTQNSSGNLYTNSNLSVTKVVTTRTIDYGKVGE